MMTWRRWLSLVDMDWSDAAICLSLLMWESVEWVRVESLFLSLSLSLFLFSLRHAVCFSLLSSPLQGHFLLCLLCFSVACLGSDSSFFLPLYFSWFFQNSKYSFGYSWLFFEMGFWVFFFASLMDFWSLWAQEIWEIVTFLVTVCGFFFLLSLNALLWDLVGYVHFRKHLCFLA